MRHIYLFLRKSVDEGMLYSDSPGVPLSADRYHTTDYLELRYMAGGQEASTAARAPRAAAHRGWGGYAATEAFSMPNSVRILDIVQVFAMLSACFGSID
ncbi:hypothetical protein Y032_0150g2746 [Ancylostoma ceylanicum]|uniref:Uncharacterized protein n=1 Tax=Ancylostoma ceylanicum TaxID=53326 RepID=A0A016T122_9BILA|nr:hypothetical protein Y032_0150g2746 [Ancylostoma ceylanicum]